MLYKIKEIVPATLVLEEKETGKEITVQLLDGKSVYEKDNDRLALISGIISNDYTIVCYNNGKYLMQNKETMEQVYSDVISQTPTPIMEDGFICLYDWVYNEHKQM